MYKQRLRRPFALVLLIGSITACVAEDEDIVDDDGDRTTQIQQAVFHPPMWIGTRCQADFQNNWQATWNNYGMCSGFNNRIDDTDPLRFYFNLHGAQNAFDNAFGAEICEGCGGADSVDFFFFQTHGGFNSTDAIWPMWDQGSFADSSSMRLGNDGRRVQVLANYSCNTLFTADNLFVTRWSNAFRGGLKFVLGAHGLVFDQADGKGADFATRLQNGETLGNAWLNAVYWADTDNRPAFVNTGTNANDCWSRASATMSSVQTIPRIQDNSIGWYCWAQWQ